MPTVGGGGVLQISSDGDDQMGAKIKINKKMQCNALKIKTAARPGYAGTTTNLQLVLNPQKTVAKFCYQKKSWNPKFQTPPKSFDYPRHLQSRVPPPKSKSACPFSLLRNSVLNFPRRCRSAGMACC